VKVIFLDFFKSSTVRTILVIYLIFFAIDKAHSIDMRHDTLGTITGLSAGQLQNFNPTHITYLVVYSNEFDFFTDSPDNYHWLWYGQPGTDSLRGLTLNGNLFEYDYLISGVIASNANFVQALDAQALKYEYQPYPSDGSDPSDPSDPSEPSTGFDINDLDYDLAGKFFASGFAIFILPWVTAYGYSSILRVIKES
jgi:hypothetical protein